MRELYAWKQIRLNCAVDRAYRKLQDAAGEGYRSRRGQYNFMKDVEQYFYQCAMLNRNPHKWDKLLVRARKHGVNRDLRELRRVFDIVLTNYFFALAEGGDERRTEGVMGND